ncbi:pilin isopeptide linkage domain protein [Collinsella sp. CAG:289]|nr:pilin isopeptide linkage domain protein [Collinsella sp. CAG:289]
MSKRMRGFAMMALVLLLALPALAMGAAPDSNASPASEGGGAQATVKVDPDTRDRWRHWAAGGGDESHISTQSVGRIWTDKTVRVADDEKSDFLTTLSVMSSTSDTTTTEVKPLDIVLVLDASGSMDDPMGGHDRTKRITALKGAAGDFIDTIAKQNKGLPAERQHKVAIVKFAGKKSSSVGNDTYLSGGFPFYNYYNYSQVMKELTPCDTAGATSLKDTVNLISPAGATRADLGLQLAQSQLSSSNGRADAKKVVVFFTDGSPTNSNEFESDVATSAVKSAKAMKDSGATIYTIGIFNGAAPTDDPTKSGTSKENRFMHAVSSNYPSATSFDTESLGSRAQNSNYYQSAATTSELEKVFSGISSSITTGAGYPTHIEDGFGPHETGYITFTDTLGDFMQVDGFHSAQINGTSFPVAGMSTEGNTDTYTFEGTAKDLVVTVERAGEANPRQGDKVTVKVPASLIPLREYKIDKAKGTFEVADIDAVKPLRVTYASSVKDVVRNNLFTPANVTGLTEYIDANRDHDANTVSFLANKWSGGDLGDTYASFRPSSANSYYYLQKVTPLYTDEACTQRATGSLEGAATYYYKDEYVIRGDDGKPKDAYTAVAIDGSMIQSFEGALTSDGTGYALAKGTARLLFIDQLHTEKTAVGGNATDTARDVLNPEWNDSSSLAGATQVNAHLGNNGKITFGLGTTPAALDTKARFGLTKKLEGRAWTDADEFTFEIGLASGDHDAQSMPKTSVILSKSDADGQGHAAIDFGTITYTKAGTYVYEVFEKDGGASGIDYSTNRARITVEVTVDKAGVLSASVTKVENPTFTNTYTSELSYSAAGGLVITKTLNGHSMAKGQFAFTVKPQDAASAKALGLSEGDNTFMTPAAADGATVSIDVLGGRDVTFTQADAGKTYSYTVSEKNGGASGYTYDTAERTVSIAVTDDSAGKLTATTTVTGGAMGSKTYTYATGERSETAKVPFTNSYSASTDSQGGSTAAIIATKEMKGRPLTDGEFTFHLAYAGTTTPLRTVRNSKDGTVDFGTFSYDTAMLADLVKNGHATKSTNKGGNFEWTVEYVAYEDTASLPKGVSPDLASFTVIVHIVDNGDGSLKATVQTEGKKCVFRNVYSTGDPVTMQLNGTKVLKSADGLTPASIEGKFTFTVKSEEAGAPMPERTEVTNDADGNIEFGGIIFTLADLNRALGNNGTADQDALELDEAANGDESVQALDGAEGAAATSAPAGDEASFELEGPVASGEASVTDAPATDEGDGVASAPVEEPGPVGDTIIESNGPMLLGMPEIETVSYKTADAAAPAATKSRSHTFVYTISESGSALGVDNDPVSTRKVSFTVTDDGAGNLTVTRNPAEGAAFTFTNSYSVESVSSSVTDQLTATKVLKGRAWTDADKFTFELVEGDTVVATGTNAKDGSIKLDPITYKGPGTHTYTLHERGAGTHDRGMTFSGASYIVVTTVSDNGDGTLSVEHAFEDVQTKKVTFTNVYRAAPASVKITAIKTLVGRDLRDGEFAFALTGEGDAADISQTAKNDARGNVSFDELTFEAPGVYTFRISEVKGTEEGMTYDESVYTITVTVVDNGEGQLEASLSYTKNEEAVEAIEFCNTFTEQKTPEKPPVKPDTPIPPTTPKGPGKPGKSGGIVTRSFLPQTGDTAAVSMVIAAALAIAGIAFIAYGRHRR